DADIEAAVWKALGKKIEPGAGRHCRRDSDDLVVVLGLGDQPLREYLGIARWTWRPFFLLAGQDIELRNTVIFVVRSLRWSVAFALVGHHVHENRTVVGVAYVLQHWDQVIEIVSVDRPDIVEAKLLEQCAAHPEATGIFFRAPRRHLQHLRKALYQPLHHISDATIGPARYQSCEIRAHRPYRWRNRHIVVVQNHDQPSPERAGVVHRLIGHARTHRPIADHADNVVLLTRK